MILRRIAIGVTLVSVALWAPWPVFLAGLVLAALLIEDYYEGVAIGLFFDLLYGNASASSVPLGAGLVLGALLAGPFLRAHLRWYS
ncbi:MAG: hypothetical protein A2408_03330 [Candidatus Yonathbacteria bacterium RIFOXYC1_FULL_52_10]|uniref:Uncharacterized protein n=1 Tax=Candidatus Yonathbacteria bacterium RIFOXYD1_FULL_52_36 TaxID=1802730 RepID=A0A1G2SID7_9BACT|nr:MAG: hypothetical protein A2408_03330 [Candidatus Yonathbacteria bacterium RIFOXYC1_FULL_52_10]OHA84724.1 MAG: hypothetical protein A2591_03325 [Candidatus Yonathbacteria bacterium RIFOXYD1_FULL_52_36]